MVLDHGGVDFAMIQYGAALKLWILGTLLTGVFIPVRTQRDFLNLAAGLAGMFLLAIVVGVIESTMARLRLIRLPQMLVAAVLLSTLAFVWILR
jgi:formate hydrogenlyase subunit 4